MGVNDKVGCVVLENSIIIRIIVNKVNIIQFMNGVNGVLNVDVVCSCGCVFLYFRW